MRREIAIFCGLFAVLSAGVAQAQGSEELVRLFPREAVITPAAPLGLARLLLPSDVLGATASDLSDVRVFDAAGREVPFLIDSAARPVLPTSARVHDQRLEPVNVSRDSRARPGLANVSTEVYRVPMPHALPASQAYELVLESSQPEFVRTLVVRDASSTSVTPLLASGSVFRLEHPRRERRTLALPANLPANLEVSIEGEGEYLSPTFALRSREPRAPERRLSIALVEIARQTSGGHTRVELARPRGVVPDRLRLVSRSRTFHRAVTVRDAGPGGEDRLLGEGSFIRAESVPDAGDDEIRLDTAPRSDRIALSIDDGESPPLEELSFEAVVSQPMLVFAADKGVLLRFGGGRAAPSAYDVQRFEGSALGQAVIERAATEAVLGDRRDNPLFDPKPALAFGMRPGPSVDTSRFSHRRRVMVESAPEGLTRISLGPDELSRANADQTDLRFVDGDGRQWPYVVERGGVARDVELGIRAVSSNGKSQLALELPRSPLSLDRIELASRTEYVDRAAELVGTTESGERRVLFRGRLSRRPGVTGPLSLAFDAARLTTLTLVIDDGSDAPFQVERASAHVTAADVYLVAPAGTYSMLFGDSAREPARYELERARGLVLAVPVGAATLGPVEPNPRYIRPRPPAPDLVLWAAIVIAVLVLGGLTLGLARRDAREVAPE
ncbi:MAG: hypothetical protein IPI67_38065 [Myxococcales bacterium]|nr:hypothetical protein [Myxococcales bacterium]